MPRTSGRWCGCTWWTSSPISATLPRCLAGWPLPPAGNASGCLRAAQLPQTAGPALDAGDIADVQAAGVEQELLLAERNAALREALSDLPPGSRRLIALLIADPPLSYAEISAILGIPVGSIGPSRSRCLDKLRRHPAIAELINDEIAHGT